VHFAVVVFDSYGVKKKMLLGVVNRCVSGDSATLSEFEEVLKAMNRPSLVPLAPRIFDLFDNNRDGTVDMREILCGFSSFKNSKGDDALRLCFQVCLFTLNTNTNKYLFYSI